MILLRPPATSYEDKFERNKFNTIWAISLTLTIVFVGLSTLHWYYNDPSVSTSLGALFFCIGVMVILYSTRKYFLSAVLGVIGGSTIDQISIHLIQDSEQVTDLMWIILVSFFAFYSLGSKYGGITLILNMVGFLIHLTMYPEYAIYNTGTTTNTNLHTVINLAIITVVIAFLIYKINQSNNSSNKELRAANKLLLEQNELVNVQHEEKTVLLKEIHHRVKNNLQVISSLLKLQASEMDNEETIRQFNEAINRVGSMALIHEKMYQTDDLAKIDLKDYLTSLMEDILSSYRNQTNIQIIIKSSVDDLDIKSLVPVALIFNELISNSLKHAFKERTDGEIFIHITEGEGNMTNIVYRDNGKWVVPQKESSFGLILIETFTEQLDGEFNRTTENGTIYTFTLPSLSE